MMLLLTIVIVGMMLAVVAWIVWAAEPAETIGRPSSPPRILNGEERQDLETRIRSLLQSNQKLDAIKLCRESMGLGLRDAYLYVENLEKQPARPPE